MSALGLIIALMIIFWYFEAGSVRQMVEDATGKPVRPIVKRVKKRDKN